jgi:hypothetical protein
MRLEHQRAEILNSVIVFTSSNKPYVFIDIPIMGMICKIIALRQFIQTKVIPHHSKEALPIASLK